MKLLFPLVIVTVLSQVSPVFPVWVKGSSLRDPVECESVDFHTPLNWVLSVIMCFGTEDVNLSIFQSLDSNPSSNLPHPQPKISPQSIKWLILNLNDKTAWLACLEQKSLALRPVAFYVLIHVAGSMALNFLTTLCFSSLATSGSVAAWSVGYQCSHDIEHVGSESSGEAMLLGMEMGSCCWLSPISGGKRRKLGQHVSWQELSITAPLPSPVTYPLVFVTSSGLAHVQRKNFTWHTALSLQFLDGALRRNFLALVYLWTSFKN